MDAAFAGGEIDEFGGGGGGVEAGESHRAFFESYGDEDDPDAYRWREEEEAYRRYVEEGVRARKRKRVSETLDGNPRRSREDVARAHADATRARDAEAQRVLDDARRQDAEWREKTSRNAAAAAAAADDAAAAAASYRERWGRAAAMIDGGAVNLRLTDVPWPVSARVLTGDAVAAKRALRAALTRGAAGAAESRKMLRTEMLRWHPDKFAGKFGGAIREKDVAEATTRVNVLARLVAELFKEAAAA
jgi:NF-kappa-B inhibitor-like protein 1